MIRSYVLSHPRFVKACFTLILPVCYVLEFCVLLLACWCVNLLSSVEGGSPLLLLSSSSISFCLLPTFESLMCGASNLCLPWQPALYYNVLCFLQPLFFNLKSAFVWYQGLLLVTSCGLSFSSFNFLRLDWGI